MSVTAVQVGSERIGRGRRRLTITPARTPVVGEVHQRRKVITVEWESGVGTAVVGTGRCEVVLYYEDSLQVLPIDRAARARPTLGRRKPKMPRRYAEYR